MVWSNDYSSQSMEISWVWIMLGSKVKSAIEWTLPPLAGKRQCWLRKIYAKINDNLLISENLPPRIMRQMDSVLLYHSKLSTRTVQQLVPIPRGKQIQNLLETTMMTTIFIKLSCCYFWNTHIWYGVIFTLMIKTTNQMLQNILKRIPENLLQYLRPATKSKRTKTSWLLIWKQILRPRVR